MHVIGLSYEIHSKNSTSPMAYTCPISWTMPSHPCPMSSQLVFIRAWLHEASCWKVIFLPLKLFCPWQYGWGWSCEKKELPFKDRPCPSWALAVPLHCLVLRQFCLLAHVASMGENVHIPGHQPWAPLGPQLCACYGTWQPSMRAFLPLGTQATTSHSKSFFSACHALNPFGNVALTHSCIFACTQTSC